MFASKYLTILVGLSCLAAKSSNAFAPMPLSISSYHSLASPSLSPPLTTPRAVTILQVTMSPVNGGSGAPSGDRGSSDRGSSDRGSSEDDLILSSSDFGNDAGEFSLKDLDLADQQSLAGVPGKYQLDQDIGAARIKYRIADNDTGSPEFQVASMTERIAYLTKHLQINTKDFSTRRGLVALVNKRRRLLNYLYKKDVTRYSTLIASLGVRHKAPGRVQGREEKYAKFATKKKK